MTAHLNLPWDEEGWTPGAAGSAATAIGARPLDLQEWMINSNREKRLVWAVYWVNGHFITRVLAVKLRQAQAALEGREGQAVVAVSTPINGPVDDARARLAQALAPLGQMSQTLGQVSASEGGR